MSDIPSLAKQMRMRPKLSERWREGGREGGRSPKHIFKWCVNCKIVSIKKFGPTSFCSTWGRNTTKGVTIGRTMGVTIGRTIGRTIGVTIGGTIGRMIGLSIGRTIGVTIGIDPWLWKISVKNWEVPWSSGYLRRLEIERWWVRIPAPVAKWLLSIFVWC